MSVVTPVRSRFFLAIGSSLVMVAGMLFGATAVAADSVQVQSYQRASQTATCDSPPEALSEWRASWATAYDPISGPTWHPSWERWANNGNGGWTCTRSITWARAPISSGSTASSYALGDIGPGGGLVFLISGGKTYEMAPKTWGAAETTGVAWCDNTTSLLPGTFGTVVGTGAANTSLMIAVGACTSGAANSATAYSGGGFTDWFLPSKDELNAMYVYKSSIVDTATYGFTTFSYWSSSQISSTNAWEQLFSTGVQFNQAKNATQRVRPIRAF